MPQLDYVIKRNQSFYLLLINNKFYSSITFYLIQLFDTTDIILKKYILKKYILVKVLKKQV